MCAGGRWCCVGLVYEMKEEVKEHRVGGKIDVLSLLPIIMHTCCCSGVIAACICTVVQVVVKCGARKKKQNSRRRVGDRDSLLRRCLDLKKARWLPSQAERYIELCFV